MQVITVVVLSSIVCSTLKTAKTFIFSEDLFILLKRVTEFDFWIYISKTVICDFKNINVRY